MLDLGAACATYADEHLRNLPCKRIECDEIWSFCYAKAKNVPDEKRGERLVVLYLPELEGKLAGLLEVIGHRGMTNLWIPDVRDCYKVDALPTLGSGKLDLKRVGEVARELAGSVC